MLKKILGQAPFDVELVVAGAVRQGKKVSDKLVFTNETEYDLPLDVSLSLSSSVKVDKNEFSVIVPANGNTEHRLVFSLDENCRMTSGKTLCEIKIKEGVLDSESDYEFELLCEMAYKCDTAKERSFLQSDQVLYSSNGLFYANKGEFVSLEVPLLEEKTVAVGVLSGKLKDCVGNEEIKLIPPLARLCFEMEEDGSFEFKNPDSSERIYLDTINPKYFV